MSDPVIIAIDLGTQSLRVSAIGLDGRRHWNVQRPVAMGNDGIRQEQDARQWRDLLLTGLREVAEAGFVPAVILASGPLAGWVPVGADGEPLAPALMYNDARTEADIATVQAALPAGTSVPRLTIADPLPHALWMRREGAATMSAARHFLDATGWLNFVLTGRATLSRYTALRLYNPGTRQQLGLDATPFGRTVEVGETIGVLVPELAERLGWPAVPVVAATFDSKCAYLGSGIHEPGDALDISGTVTSFGTVSATRVDDREDRIYSVPFGERWLVRGSTAAAGSIIEWAREALAFSIAELDHLALTAPVSLETDPVFVPYLAGARAPLWRPRARGSLTGLSLGTGRADLARSIYAGLALSVRHIVDTIESCGAEVRHIRLAGGLSRSAALAQIKADILGRPVTVMADAELTTMGMAAIGAAHLGAYPTIGAAARRLSQDATTFHPRLPAQEASALYARYLRGAGLSVSLVPPAPTVTNSRTSAA
jgi:xylulokinase